MTPAGWHPDPLSPATQRRYWTGDEWSEWVTTAPQATVTRTPVETNHTFHLLMTIFTCVLWAPVWALVHYGNRHATREVVTTEAPGEVWSDPLALTSGQRTETGT